MSNKKWTDNDLIEAVKESNTFAEVIRKLKLSNYGANSRTIKKYIAKLSLSAAHFLTRGEQLKIARSKIKTLTIDQIFSINQVDRKHVKNTILENNLVAYECANCHITSWQGQELSLHLDHINGINNDNRLENLRFLCPNCHSLTDSYCGKNLKTNQEKNYCQDCGIKISRQSSKCIPCNSKNKKTKIEWPHHEELQEMVNELGYSGTGRKLGVSDNAVRKRLKNHGES